MKQSENLHVYSVTFEPIMWLFSSKLLRTEILTRAPEQQSRFYVSILFLLKRKQNHQYCDTAVWDFQRFLWLSVPVCFMHSVMGGPNGPGPTHMYNWPILNEGEIIE